jgi:ubiquinone/menaquinone biosynthesis C-methylase UbiE
MAAGLGGASEELVLTGAVAKSLAEAAGESEFWAVEQLAWGDSAVAEVYEQNFNSLTRQCIPAVLDAVGCEEGTRLLDVATGPGYVLLAALVRCSRLRPTALATGQRCCQWAVTSYRVVLPGTWRNVRRHRLFEVYAGPRPGQHPRADAPLPGVMLLPGDAQALPFQQSTVEETGGLFDVVVCNFGVLHLGEPQKFFAEAFRVPAPANTSLYLAAHILQSLHTET